MKKATGLGRGLSALIGEAPAAEAEAARCRRAYERSKSRGSGPTRPSRARFR